MQRKTDKRKDLNKEFDALYKEMQTSAAQAAFNKLLNVSPHQLTRAARKSVKRNKARE
jgi:outer membrane lipopolysaccharide assembly protein LptE/RlpB